MGLKTFPNVVGCHVDRAYTLIDTYLKSQGITYYVKSVPYDRQKHTQKKNEIILYLDKFNEVISTPFITFDEYYGKNSIEEEEDDDKKYKF